MNSCVTVTLLLSCFWKSSYFPSSPNVFCFALEECACVCAHACVCSCVHVCVYVCVGVIGVCGDRCVVIALSLSLSEPGAPPSHKISESVSFKEPPFWDVYSVGLQIYCVCIWRPREELFYSLGLPFKNRVDSSAILVYGTESCVGQDGLRLP